jgi:membrane-associated protease RseP (regulator of RpoE activity)
MNEKPVSDLPSFPEARAPADRGIWARQETTDPPPSRRDWRVNAVLFVLTVLSVFATRGGVLGPEGPRLTNVAAVLRALRSGWTFAVPLLAILVVHEFGHYIAARIHRVDASLPYFLPLPVLSIFGTMGAIIAMRGRIRSRNALLDIGASGPLAGLVVAIPVLVVGLSLSPVIPSPAGHYHQEGQSLLYIALKRLVLGPIPEGYDVDLHPTAFAGWAGLLLTMLNLLPWGQLDGGHVAYALFGTKQDRYARLFRALLLPLFLYNFASLVLPVARGSSTQGYAQAALDSVFWLLWYVLLGVVGRFSGGAVHPPTEPGELSPGRRVVAGVTLVLFVMLFMPTPLVTY